YPAAVASAHVAPRWAIAVVLTRLTETRIARPTVGPTSMAVLTTPPATPRSWAGTSARAATVEPEKDSPSPRVTTASPGHRAGKEPFNQNASSNSPADAPASPAAATASGPARRIQRLAGPPVAAISSRGRKWKLVCRRSEE